MQAHAFYHIPDSMLIADEMHREQVRAQGTINYTAFARGIARILIVRPSLISGSAISMLLMCRRLSSASTLMCPIMTVLIEMIRRRRSLEVTYTASTSRPIRLMESTIGLLH